MSLAGRGSSSDTFSRLAWRSALTYTFILFTSLSVYALDPNQPLKQLHHSNWSGKNGLTGTVLALDQTSDGYLWIGTSDGLFRFDGLYFDRYKPEKGAFPSTAVSSLLATPDGGLWIGYQKGGATFLKNGQTTNYSDREGFPVSRVRCFARDHEGTVWAATVGGFTRFDGTRWQTLRMEWNYSSKSAWTLFVDRHGTLWVTTGKSIMYLLKGGRQFRDTGIEAGVVVTFKQAPDGTYLFAEDEANSIRAFRAPGDTRTDPLLQINIPARWLHFDRHRALWIAGSGLSRIPFLDQVSGKPVTDSSAGVERLTNDDGLTDVMADEVFEDREGNIWIATPGGLDRFRYRNLSWFPFPAGTGDFTLVAGDNGEVWTGSNGNTPHAFADVEGKRKFEGGPIHVLVTYRDPDGPVWIGGIDVLVRWTKDGFETIRPPPEMVRLVSTSTTKDPIMASAITKDPSGAMWVSFGGGGQFLYKDGSWTFVELLKEHPDWASNSAFTDSRKQVWFAFSDRIVRVADNKVQAFTTAEGLTVGPHNTFAERNGQLLVGGESGLAFLQGERFHQIKGVNGSTFGSITGIIARENDGLWLSSSEGILYIPEPEIHLLQQNDYQVRYEVLDLVSDLPEQLQRTGVYSTSAVQSSDGRLWFATRGGVALVYPSRIYRNPLAPPVVIRSVIADGKSYSTFENVSLPPLTRNLEFDYTALSLSVPERIRFRYMLEGADKDWQEAGTRRLAIYTNLGPGKYVFRVIACNNDGIWNDAGAIFAFEVTPAWHQTAWFTLLVLVMAAFVVWGAYRIRVAQVARNISARFDERLEERTHLARELHDTLLQTIQGSTMIADHALDPDSDPERQRAALQQLSRWLRRASQEGRAALNSLRTPTIEHHDLAEALRRETQSSLIPTSMEITFSVNGEPREIHPIVRDEVYRIGHEAISNSLLHSKASRVEVELKYARDLSLRVKDNGTGIDAAFLEKGKDGHFGLAGMKERATRIGGKLTIASSSSGTEVAIGVPSDIAYGTTKTARFKRLLSVFHRRIHPD